MNRNDDNQNRTKLIAIYVTIPFVVGIPPILGWWIGSWLDRVLNTGPYLMFLLIILGFAASFRELFRIIRKFGDEI